MYCPNCGSELAENIKFCAYCGSKIDVGQPAESSSVEKEQPDFRQTTERQDLKQSRDSHNGNRWWQILLVFIICAAAVAVFFFVRPGIQERQFNNHMEDGRNLLNEGSYDEAVAEFLAAIEIDPKAVPAYEQLAESYIELDEPKLVDGAYQDGRDVILDSYEEFGLLDGAEDFYESAITYYGEKGVPAEVTELVDEITGMLDNKEEAEKIEQLGQTYVDNKDVSKEEPSEEVRPSEEKVDDLLETFKDWADNMLRLYYSSYVGEGTDDLLSYETIDAPEAYVVAALALREDRDVPHGDLTYYLDGNFYTLDEYNAMSMDLKTDVRSYVPLSTSYYEDFLQNLFGEEYSLDDFTEYEDQVKDTVFEDEDGQFYVIAGDYINEGVDISIVDFSDTPDENGLYTVLAEYTTHWDGGEPDTVDYMQYRIAPNDSSAYGCRIAGMVPAGNGEIEDAFKPQAEAEEADDNEPYMEWQQLYADYIEGEYREEDTMAEIANQTASEEVKEYYYYYLIYLNDDDVPELLRCSSPNYLRGMTNDVLLYIQDSQVKEQEIVSVTLAERGGYILSEVSSGAYMTFTVWRLNEQNELVTELEAYEDFTEISINGQDVSQEEFDRAGQEGTAWRTSGEYTVLYAGYGTLNLFDTDEEYASPFATGASKAIEALRGGYVEPV